MPTKNLFILTGPSGAGEDSIINGLKKSMDIEQIITTTTRQMRPNESQGNPYYFISKEEFKEGIKNNNFFEWAEEDGGNLYGGTHEEIERVQKSGLPIIWKIDYKGAISSKKLFPDSKSILINVPFDILEKRIRNRNEVTEEFVQDRLEYAKGWAQNRDIFDYEIVNEEGKLDKTISTVVDIIKNSFLSC